MVVEIKNMLKKGIMQKEIAKMFNVSRSTISEINTNKKWINIKTMKHI
jgi:predicted XRE-type DNA-binding protein